MPTTKPVENVSHSEPKRDLNKLHLILCPVNIRPGDRIIVDQKMLDSIPSSKYSIATWQGIRSKSNTDIEDDENSSDATIPYSDSTVYESKPCLKRRRKPSKSTKSFKFRMRFHGIRRRQCTYNFTCKMPRCGRKFTTTRDWNSHHRIQHGTKLKCNICGKKYPSPSSYRDHHYTH